MVRPQLPPIVTGDSFARSKLSEAMIVPCARAEQNGTSSVVRAMSIARRSDVLMRQPPVARGLQSRGLGSAAGRDQVRHARGCGAWQSWRADAPTFSRG